MNATSTSPSPSASLVCTPRYRKCRYWAKVVRAEDIIPLPSAVDGANAIPGPYLRRGDDVELFRGDFLLEGEENHHAKRRGWTYDMRTVDASGEIVAVDYKVAKDALRAAGAPKDLLLGSGDCAAMIRAIHWARRAARHGKSYHYGPQNQIRVVGVGLSGCNHGDCTCPMFVPCADLRVLLREACSKLTDEEQAALRALWGVK